MSNLLHIFTNLLHTGVEAKLSLMVLICEVNTAIGILQAVIYIASFWLFACETFVIISVKPHCYG